MIVELDGLQHLDESKYDARRDAILKSNGYRVLRFWNADVLHRTEPVLETIFAAMNRAEFEEASSSSSPSVADYRDTSPALRGREGLGRRTVL